MWSGLRIYGLDSSVELRFADPRSYEFLSAAEQAWSRCLEPVGVSREAEPLDVAAPDRRMEQPLAVALQRLTQEVTVRLIDSQAGRLLMLHAGAVSHPVTGRTLTFVAPGGTGKTTLARNLGAHYGYVSDETVAIDPETGRIHPYPKPLSLRLPHDSVKRETSPDELGLVRVGVDPTVSRIIVLTRDVAHNGPPILAEFRPVEAIAAILPETSWIRTFAQPLTTLHEFVEAHGPVLGCTYREANDLTATARDLIGAAS